MTAIRLRGMAVAALLTLAPPLERWGPPRLAAIADAAATWGRRHRRPVWCSEFGARREGSDPVQRGAWISDVRQALEARGIGWTLWDYRGGFGLFAEYDGTLAADPVVTPALGLPAP